MWTYCYKGDVMFFLWSVSYRLYLIWIIETSCVDNINTPAVNTIKWLCEIEIWHLFPLLQTPPWLFNFEDCHQLTLKLLLPQNFMNHHCVSFPKSFLLQFSFTRSTVQLLLYCYYKINKQKNVFCILSQSYFF